MPFSTTLSLEPVIEFWESASREGRTEAGLLVPQIRSYLDRNPALRRPITDLSIVKGHRTFLDMLFSAFFPPAFSETEPGAALIPFEYRSFYATPAFARLFCQESGTISGRVNLDLRTFTYGKIISAYLHILRTVYGVDIVFEYPVTFTTQDAQTGLDRHFKVTTDLRFVRINQIGALPQLTEDAIRGLLANFSDLSDWMQLIPPSAFEFYGLSIVRASDVTDEWMIATLERDLVEDDSLVGRAVLSDIEGHVRTLLQMPHLELGLAAVDGDEFYLLNEPSHHLVDTFFTRSARYDLSDLEGSIFERCLKERTIQVIEDLGSAPDRSIIERDLLRWGVRNVIAAPLVHRSENIGVLYVWSPRPASLHALNVMKLLELLPIFSAAVQRAREEMRNRVQNVIMGKFTAIHPTVEWRIQQAARNFIQQQEEGGRMEIEPIVFENVYPLFAATDIRSSSDHRNLAVQHDLIEHLDVARAVVAHAGQETQSAMFHHLLARTDRYRTSLEAGLVSSDEAAVRDFIQADLEPILQPLRGTSDELDRLIVRYEKAADPQEGTLYSRSRAFEQSVQLVNDTISDFVDAEQDKIQPLFPHYFEKHQTDGIDFTIYAGDSLLEDGAFDMEHVSILRLWQLTVLCGIAARIEALRDRLDVPLETTHLVLVQNTPISIRYRFDEARFDVDGPHHVRFEIMKQRVEKAYIKRTSERLTQPDRIAIVYSQDREIREYGAYVGYLQERGFIAPDVENVELDDLQGMKGLQALRLHVDARAVDALPEVVPDELAQVARSVSV